MISACAIPAGAPSLARDILANTDCLIAGRVESAYAALLAPGGSFAQILTLALVIYVAIFGYRLILGLSSLSLAEVVPHFVKIGVILALVTSWSSYQTVVFDLMFHGPEQLANAIMRQTSDLPGSGPSVGQGDVLAALQSLFNHITDYAGEAWAQVNPAVPPAAPVKPPVFPGAVAATPPPPPVALPFQLGAAQFTAAILWIAALVMMAASVGVLLVVRIILALLLIIGPIFIACGLFSGSRGLFEGWLRTTVKFAVVPLFTLPLTAALVGVLLPFAADLGGPVDHFRDGPALAIFVIVMVFAAVLFQTVRLAGGIAAGLRLPRRPPAAAPVAASGAAAARPQSPSFTPSRTDIIVQSLGGRTASTVAEGNRPGVVQMTRLVSGLSAPPAANIDTGSRLGQSYRRLTVTTRAPQRNRP